METGSMTERRRGGEDERMRGGDDERKRGWEAEKNMGRGVVSGGGEMAVPGEQGEYARGSGAWGRRQPRPQE